MMAPTMPAAPAVLPQPPAIAPPQGLLPPPAVRPTKPGFAAALPGMSGSPATNVIDRLGGLDATGQAVDGNHAAGIRKGAARRAARPLTAQEVEELQAQGHGPWKCASCGDRGSCRCLHGGQLPTRVLSSCSSCGVRKEAVVHPFRPLNADPDFIQQNRAWHEAEKARCRRFETSLMHLLGQAKQAAQKDPSYSPEHPEECCPSCGARLERGDNGNCNRCGKPWPETLGTTLGKAAAVEIVSGKRQSKPVFSLLDRVVFPESERQPPNEADLASWQRVADYMAAARPAQLNTAKVISGRADPSVLINQVATHQPQDSWPEVLNGIRDFASRYYANLTPTAMEQYPASYQPYANTVILNERAPGVLMHELGHGVDLAPREGEMPFKRYLRWNFKPLLWQELSAWKKGRKAYQEGYAASPEADQGDHAEYRKTMQSYNSRKYPAYGTYLGGALGATTGAAAAVVAALMAAKNGNQDAAGSIIQMAPLPAALGSAAGVWGGALLGRQWAKWRERALAEKAMRQLQQTRQGMSPRQREAIRARLLAYRSEREQPVKAKTKSEAA